jgi:hypothetical protein
VTHGSLVLGERPGALRGSHLEQVHAPSLRIRFLLPGHDRGHLRVAGRQKLRSKRAPVLGHCRKAAIRTQSRGKSEHTVLTLQLIATLRAGRGEWSQRNDPPRSVIFVTGLGALVHLGLKSAASRDREAVS